MSRETLASMLLMPACNLAASSCGVSPTDRAQPRIGRSALAQRSSRQNHLPPMSGFGWLDSLSDSRVPHLAFPCPSLGCLRADRRRVSVQVGEVGENWFSVYLIPETLRVTVLGGKGRGDTVNIEIDAQTQARRASLRRTTCDNCRMRRRRSRMCSHTSAAWHHAHTGRPEITSIPCAQAIVDTVERVVARFMLAHPEARGHVPQAV